MAFIKRGFNTVADMGKIATTGICNALHTYITNDNAAAVEGSGYFNAMAYKLKIGDIILCSLDIDGTPAGRIYLVSSNNGTAVGLTLFTATAAA